MEKELQDRAWRSLPEDFREEVKKEWQSANNKERLIHDAFLRGEHAMLVSIFGLNNLNTSHKQPEDENQPGKTSHGNRNLSQDTANCEISRLQIAAMAMQGLLNATSFERFSLRIKPEAIAEAAFEYADALIRANEMAYKPTE